MRSSSTAAIALLLFFSFAVASGRAGEADAGPWRQAVLDHLKATVADKLDVAKPPRPE